MAQVPILRPLFVELNDLTTLVPMTCLVSLKIRNSLDQRSSRAILPWTAGRSAEQIDDK
jgi:hypothetical protein